MCKQGVVKGVRPQSRALWALRLRAFVGLLWKGLGSAGAILRLRARAPNPASLGLNPCYADVGYVTVGKLLAASVSSLAISG